MFLPKNFDICRINRRKIVLKLLHKTSYFVEVVSAPSGNGYLHRKEGDQGNAAYWYGRAGKPVCREPLGEEWLSIVKGLLG